MSSYERNIVFIQLALACLAFVESDDARSLVEPHKQITQWNFIKDTSIDGKEC